MRPVPFSRDNQNNWLKPRETDKYSQRNGYRPELKFSEVVAGLQTAAEKVLAQKEYIRTLEKHCGKMAQGQKSVESVAAALHVEAQRTHKTIPDMQS